MKDEREVGRQEVGSKVVKFIEDNWPAFIEANWPELSGGPTCLSGNRDLIQSIIRDIVHELLERHDALHSS